jgi:hypothetical protein
VGIWRDKASGKWKYAFQVNGKPYGGGGYQTKGEARMAREEKRKAILSGADSIAKETPTTRMGFAHLADLYLTQSQRRHADKTYRYKKYVYASFLKHAGDIPMDKITPYLVQSYLQTRVSNSNYNRHRKDLGALFEYARRVLGIIQVNPCNVIEKLRFPKKSPHRKSLLS